jgi:hypothetical protein
MRRSAWDILAEAAALLVVCVVAVLLVLLLSWTARGVFGAPVPPPPRELPAGVLPGKWQYAWGGHENGTMWVFADGTYTAVHGSAHAGICGGTWAVEGWELVLTETVFYPMTGTHTAPQTYRVRFDGRSLATLSGVSNGTQVVLKNRVRDE